MDLKVGDKVRLKSKEWFEQFGCYNDASSDYYGKEAIITERTVYGYSINIGPKDLCWLETCFEPMSNWSVNIPKDTELTKTVTVNVPNDMEVSTSEDNGNITINIQHKEEKKEETKFKDGDILFLTDSYSRSYISIFKREDYETITVHGWLNTEKNEALVSLDDDDIYIKKYIKVIRHATEEEIAKFNKEFAEQKQLRWNTEELKFEEYRWRAERGEKYWRITDIGTVVSSIDFYSPFDNILYNLRNYFQTEELAKVALPKLEEFFINLNVK